MKRIITIISMLVFCFALSLDAAAATVKITWNANTESDLAGYKLYYGTSSDAYGTPIDVGNVTSYTVTINPTVTTTYYVALTAYDTSGNVSWYISTTSTKPETAAVSFTQSNAASAGMLAFASEYAGENIFDKARVDDAAIGSAPE